jgi:hypothetical protein
MQGAPTIAVAEDAVVDALEEGMRQAIKEEKDRATALKASANPQQQPVYNDMLARYDAMLAQVNADSANSAEVTNLAQDVAELPLLRKYEESYLATLQRALVFSVDARRSGDAMTRTINNRNFYSCWAFNARSCRIEEAQRDEFYRQADRATEQITVTQRIPTLNIGLGEKFKQLEAATKATRFDYDSTGISDMIRQNGENLDRWIKALDNTITGIKWTRTAISTVLIVCPPAQRVFDSVSTGMDVLTGQITLEDGAKQLVVDLVAGKAGSLGKQLVTKVGRKGIAQLVWRYKDNPAIAKSIGWVGKKGVGFVGGKVDVKVEKWLRDELEPFLEIDRRQRLNIRQEVEGVAPGLIPNFGAQLVSPRAQRTPLSCGERGAQYAADLGPFSTLTICRAACPQPRSAPSSEPASSSESSVSSEPTSSESSSETSSSDASSSSSEPEVVPEPIPEAVTEPAPEPEPTATASEPVAVPEPPAIDPATGIRSPRDCARAGGRPRFFSQFGYGWSCTLNGTTYDYSYGS